MKSLASRFSLIRVSSTSVQSTTTTTPSPQVEEISPPNQAETLKIVRRSKSKSAERKKRRKLNPRYLRHRLNNSYKSSIWKILKNVHPNLGLTKNSVLVLNSLLNDMFTRLVEQALHFKTVSRRRTLSQLDMAAACKMILPGGLGVAACTGATRAVVQFQKAKIEQI